MYMYIRYIYINLNLPPWWFDFGQAVGPKACVRKREREERRRGKTNQDVFGPRRILLTIFAVPWAEAHSGKK